MVSRLVWLLDLRRRSRLRARASVLTEDREDAEEDEEEDVEEDVVDIDDEELPRRTPRAHREMARSTTAVIIAKRPPCRSEDDDDEPEDEVVTEVASSLRKEGSPR